MKEKLSFLVMKNIMIKTQKVI